MIYTPSKTELDIIENILKRGGKTFTLEDREHLNRFKKAKRQAMVDTGFQMTDEDFLLSNRK